MMKKFKIVLGLTLSQVAAFSAMAMDAKGLLDQQCVSCHQADIYKRDNRKVKSLTSLGTAVENCNTQLSTGWFPEDVDAVVKYLNQHYYKFKR